MKKAAAVLALVLASTALVACGSSGSTTTTTPTGGGSGASTGGAGAAKSAQTVKLSTDPGGQLKSTTAKLSAKAGNVTIDFTNPQPLSHDVAVADSSGTVLGKSDLIEQGSTSLTLMDLKPGTYTYYCTVAGHKEAGMQGTLTVR